MVYCGMQPCMIWSTCLHGLNVGQGNFMFDFQAQRHATHFYLYLAVDHKLAHFQEKSESGKFLLLLLCSHSYHFIFKICLVCIKMHKQKVEDLSDIEEKKTNLTLKSNPGVQLLQGINETQQCTCACFREYLVYLICYLQNPDSGQIFNTQV